MDFSLSTKAQNYVEKLEKFMDEWVYPNEYELEQGLQGNRKILGRGIA